MGSIKSRSLIEKGWTKEDISQAIGIIERAKKSRHPKIKILDRAVYWLSLLLAVIGNLIISVALLPFLLALSGMQLYLIIIALGLAFGLLFELLVRGIENLEAMHHLFLGIIVPIAAVINFIIVSDNAKKIIGVENPQNSIIAGSAYAAAFIMPYIAYQVFLKRE